MRKPKKSTYVAAAALALTLSAAGVTAINAQTGTAQSTSAQTEVRPSSSLESQQKNPMNSLVSALAAKFNLNEAEVKSFIEETMKTEHQAMEAKRSEDQAQRLSQAVTNGTLTQAQADLITAKYAELKSQMETDRSSGTSLTPEQMKTKMEADRAALKEWATANNIPEDYLREFHGGFGKGGDHGAPRGPKPAEAAVPSVTTSITAQN